MTAVTAVLYTIELLTAEPIFDIAEFSLNYVVSFPYILLSIVINSGIAAMTDKLLFRKRKPVSGIIVGALSAAFIAVFLVMAGNLPFISDMAGFVRTASFWKSVAAATLLNIFIQAAAGFAMQIIAKRNLQKENAVLMYRQLKNQVNPHFLFNSLNVLVSLINKDRDKAVEYTKKLSSVYRYILAQDSKDTVTVKEEIDFIHSYIDILQSRFAKGLEFTFDIQPADLSKSIPAMSLQLLIENAVKHNAVLPDSPLVIDISSDGNAISVSNNLKPRLSHSGGTGTGLMNLSGKYVLLAGKDIQTIKDNNTFTVKLPLL